MTKNEALERKAENARELGLDYEPERTWVGLTDEEIAEIRLKTFDAVATNHEVYRAIEAKLKEKNR